MRYPGVQSTSDLQKLCEDARGGVLFSERNPENNFSALNRTITCVIQGIQLASIQEGEISSTQQSKQILHSDEAIFQLNLQTSDAKVNNSIRT